jgi:hypothetical protein
VGTEEGGEAEGAAEVYVEDFVVEGLGDVGEVVV